MKLVSYNIQYGIGRDGRFDLERIAASLAGADIIALQEVTRNFSRNEGADVVAGITALLPDYFHVFGPAMDVDFGGRDGDGRPANKRLNFGNMVLSRWPIVGSRNLLLPRSRRFNRGNLQRSALEALIVTPDEALRVYSVHLDHVNVEERLQQIGYLKQRAFGYPLEGGAFSGGVEFGFPEPPCPEGFVLMGDFNMVQGSPEYVAMTGSVDDVEGRQIVAHHPVDAFTLGEPLPAGSVSWVDDGRPERNRLIDYAFLHASLAGRVGKTWIDSDAHGSDHLPVWLEMN
ncbi:Metal-dependent hydrolase, endonuclease/exonuclease/phosphatase family [Mesorhizobium albiziae]|uniref:Metal-dependent hydrolase, endonuclease/exonuclease/phosphatase family n=1 Tax=Neomesorhizobium albiziae TaxID=335020 RepID=A0A1I3XL29_9HYPH|nr:endonuclease/exonuclease/phosphatase family protein [Mesorhizobium albiziae]GLS30356.1 endonuclease/exonuclease/phosphatase [Mesorhizobium albiziae]SFK20205.1 Metal-dependent hydrolase, endonuclease/exonuclease/phosphatase family [Mesorhizobium albiziae]